MKLKKLKQLLDKMTPKELEQELVYHSNDLCISGVVKKVKKQPFDLLYDGSDDPAVLRSRNGWLEEGMDAEEVDEMDVEIRKGQWIIEF